MASESSPEGAALIELFESCGALRRGHFRLSSGLHSSAYVQCALLLELPERARAMGRALADRLRGQRIESVLSPALGGVVIGHETAAALGVPFRFAERGEAGVMALRRGFVLREGERIAVVEDVVTTGKSTRETAELAERSGAQVVAIGSILDRSAGRHGFEVPYEALAELGLPAYSGESCPLCAAGGVAEKPGSRPG